MKPKRTARELITESTIELLRSRDIAKITVRDIVRNCGISTQAFYNHFCDKYQVIARYYTDSVAPYVACTLEEWYRQKARLFMSETQLYARAFSYSGQNSLTQTLINFDQQKYLLHVKPEILGDPAQLHMVRQGIICMIYGQFGLFYETAVGSMDVTAEEFSARYGSISEIIREWMPQILVRSLQNQINCQEAYWDSALETIVVRPMV